MPAKSSASSSSSSDSDRKGKKKKKAKKELKKEKKMIKAEKRNIKKEMKKLKTKKEKRSRSSSGELARRSRSRDSASKRLAVVQQSLRDFGPSSGLLDAPEPPVFFPPPAPAVSSGGAPAGCGDSKGKGKGKDGKDGKDGEEVEKEKPNFEASGLLAVEDNSKNGVPMKFTMPAESRRPAAKWRLYIFAKGVEQKVVHVHRLAGYLFGKDRRVADIPTDHQTCSKQHAVLHYRMVDGKTVRPYIMDLESMNGTFLNGEKLDPARYYEMRPHDVLKFGMSSREYVLLHSGAANHLEIDPKLLRSPSQ